MTTPQHDAKSNTPNQPPEVSRQVPGWGHVDEASWESFPASDSPAHGAGAEGAPPTLNGEPYGEPSATRMGEPPAREPSRLEQLRAKADVLKHQAEHGWSSLRAHVRAFLRRHHS